MTVPFAAEHMAAEISRLRSEVETLNAKLGEQQIVPDTVRDALARRCLWLAFVWNDHNFQSAHIEARKEAEKHGITSFDDANEWLSAPSAPAAQGWIPVSERLPEVMNILDEPCYLEGRAVPALYVSEEVMRFDGKRVTTGTIEWFHKKLPHVFTHWMPLPAAPATAAAMEGSKGDE